MIVITGSAGGIGSAIVKAFSNGSGKQVFGIDRHNCDLRNEPSIEKVLQEVTEPVDVLVNCAGVSLKGQWDETFAVNVRAAYIISTLVAKEMPWGGSIINITSINAHLGFPGNPAYVASKAALLGLTRAMAVDLAPRIRVNAVCPGYIRTPMTEQSYLDIPSYYERLNRMLINRWGTPEDVAGAVKFLASDAAKYITGAEIVVDGGYLVKGL